MQVTATSKMILGFHTQIRLKTVTNSINVPLYNFHKHPIVSATFKTLDKRQQLFHQNEKGQKSRFLLIKLWLKRTSPTAAAVE